MEAEGEVGADEAEGDIGWPAFQCLLQGLRFDTFLVPFCPLPVLGAAAPEPFGYGSRAVESISACLDAQFRRGIQEKDADSMKSFLALRIGGARVRGAADSQLKGQAPVERGVQSRS